jgi:hypothetical protein
MALSLGTKVWANRIAAAWQSSIDGILETGRLLMEAKKLIPHGDFERMIENELPFKKRTAQRLMAISKDKRIASHATLLPASWYTLWELTRLEDAQFEQGIKAGEINPGMERADVARLAPPKAPKAKPTVTDVEYEDLTEPPQATPASAGDPPLGGGAVEASTEHSLSVEDETACAVDGSERGIGTVLFSETPFAEDVRAANVAFAAGASVFDPEPGVHEKGAVDREAARDALWERAIKVIEAARRHIRSYEPGTLVGSELNLAHALAEFDGEEEDWSAWLVPGELEIESGISTGVSEHAAQ